MNELPETTRPSREPRMTNKRSRGCAAVACTLFLLGFLPAASQAQVATHSLYQGQLTDAAGVPRTGPVNLRLHLYAAESGGAPLYSEDHAAVALDAQGMFAVSLGSGSVLSGSYDTALLERPPLYLEIVFEPLGENVTLSPRQRLGAVPSARVAEAPVRFEDCGDGTVADHKTGLLWEKKTGTPTGAGINCRTTPGGCPDPHDVNNRYQWSNTGTAPDGKAYTDFLARLNGDPTVVAATGAEARGDPADDPTVCLAHHCDWRLPVITELSTIQVGAPHYPTEAEIIAICGPQFPRNCTLPDFAAVGDPTAPGVYWSASSYPPPPTTPRPSARARMFGANSIAVGKAFSNFVRAVRAGSCN